MCPEEKHLQLLSSSSTEWIFIYTIYCSLFEQINHYIMHTLLILHNININQAYAVLITVLYTGLYLSSGGFFFCPFTFANSFTQSLFTKIFLSLKRSWKLLLVCPVLNSLSLKFRPQMMRAKRAYKKTGEYLPKYSI